MVKRWSRWIFHLFVFTMKSLWDVDHNVRRWGQLLCVAICSTLVRCYWCISILIIIPNLWRCSLIGLHSNWPPVVLSDCRYPCFRNFDSTISIDVIWMKSYMDSFLDPLCVPVRVTINKLNFVPNGTRNNWPHHLMKTSSIAVKMSRSTSQSDSIALDKWVKNSSILNLTCGPHDE